MEFLFEESVGFWCRMEAAFWKAAAVKGFRQFRLVLFSFKHTDTLTRKIS